MSFGAGGADFIERRINLAGFETRMLQSLVGRGRDDLSLLFLHGWSDSADTYKPLLRALATHGIGGIAFDLPHCGRADDLRPGAHLPQFVAFARAAIDFAGKRVLPVGQSLGGRLVLMALAEGVAADVPACVAIAPAPLVLPPWQRMLVRNGALAYGVSLLGQGERREQLVSDIVQSFRRSCFVAPDSIPDSVYADYASHYDPARVQRHIGALRQIGEELAEPFDLSQLHCPVDLIWGTHDRLAPLAGAQSYQQLLPQAKLTVLQNCGHHVHLERVAEVAEFLMMRIDAG